MIFLFPFLVVATGLFFWILMLHKYRQPDRAMDLGEVMLAIILIYGLVPAIGFLLTEFGFEEIQDGRLFEGYLLEQVEYVQLLFLLMAGSFAVTYAFSRKEVIGKIDHSAETARLVWPVVATAIALTITLSVITQIWGADVGEDYISSYTQLRSAPVLVQQFTGIGTQIQLSLTIAAVSFAVAAWPKRHVYVALALVTNIGFTVLAGGSRTNAFLALLSYIIASSVYVRGFQTGRAALLAAPALLLFLVAGLLRGEVNEINFFDFFVNSEFTAVFVTPLDLHIRFPNGFAGQAPFNLYTVDLFRFIPAQLLPFEKANPAEWYTSTFYGDYAAAGGGFAFGILAETALGQGAPEAIVRGALLGALFAFVGNRLHTKRASPVQIVAYIWLMVLGYQCYRDTTFSIGARMLFHLVPVLIFIVILRSSRKDVPIAIAARTT